MVESFLSLAAFIFVASVTPGPNNMMLLASGAAFGISRTVPHMAGVAIGFGSMIVLADLGLGGFLAASPVVAAVLMGASLCFLAYLAWRIAIASPPRVADAATRPMTFLEAVAFQGINPKAWAVIVAMLSLFSAPANGEGLSTLSVLLAFILFGTPSMLVWCAFGRAVARFFRKSDRAWRLFSIAMAVLLLVSAIVPMLS